MSDDEFESLADGSWKYEIESLRQQLSESRSRTERVQEERERLDLIDSYEISRN